MPEKVKSDSVGDAPQGTLQDRDVKVHYEKCLLDRAVKVCSLFRPPANKKKFRQMIQKSFPPVLTRFPEDYSVAPWHIEKMEKSPPEDYLVKRAWILSALKPVHRQKVSDQEQLVAGYNILTILHDNCYEFEEHIPLIGDDNWHKTNAGWVEPMWEEINYAYRGDKANTILEILDIYIDLVEKDLADGKDSVASNNQVALGVEIRIKLDDFSNTPSRRLLEDLLLDIARNGITLDESKHGKDQPKTLKKALRDHGLKQVASKIHKKKNTVNLDILAKNIEIQSKNYLP